MAKEKQRDSLRHAIHALELSYPRAAEIFGIHPSRLPNILRKQSKSASSSLDEDLAFKIQAATGISAASLMRGDKPALMLNGSAVSLQAFEDWQDLPINEETKLDQAGELGFMAALLLEAAGAKGNHLRRRTYHLIRSALDEIRKAAGISLTEIHEAARQGATFSSLHATRDQLDEELSDAPAYKAIRSSLPAKGTIEVSLEKFPTWCDLDEAGRRLPEVIDEARMTRFIYRIKTGETWHGVVRDRREGKGVASPSRHLKIKKARRK